MTDGPAMRGGGGSSRPVARVGIWCILGLSVATWLAEWAGYILNPERVGSVFWDALGWSWPLCLLALAWRRPPRKREVVLAAIAPLFAACALCGSTLLSGSPYALQRIQRPSDTGRPVRLALLKSSGWMRECDEVTVVLGGGWVLQRLGFAACSGHDYLDFMDPATLALEPGPTADTFALSVERTLGDNGPKRVRIGVYRLGLAGRLVRVAGGDDDRR